MGVGHIGELDIVRNIGETLSWKILLLYQSPSCWVSATLVRLNHVPATWGGDEG